MYLSEYARDIHGIAEQKGFWSDPEFMDKLQAKLMLVVTEVAEVSEALRKNKGGYAVTEECVDIIIRLLDLFDVMAEKGYANPNIDEIIRAKIGVNRNRPALHGNAWG